MTTDDLWEFALVCYGRPGVEPACLQLQDGGADVCLMLCGLWLEARRVDCDAERLAALTALAGPWQAEVVTPLRRLRRHWRQPASSDPALAKLRSEVKALELAAERELLSRLQARCLDWPAAAAPAPWLEALAPDQPQPLRVLREAALSR
ncbi:TIGR02444 family protein [Stutzerimonas azotifigens]|uniref:TIGR02444 family protein n=1 Tax=Stutzerimonas azotifigens TaxID=291995 RepID=UPI0004147464|nr:TIGR02444 family protein [Stutzerimonas azotifigens]